MFSRRGMSSRRTVRNLRTPKVPKPFKQMVRVGPPLFSSTINVPERIPEHTANPRVTRIVRLYLTLTNAAQSISITYGALGSQDSSDYGVATYRYQFMRVSKIKVWMEIPNGLSVSVVPPNLVLTDAAGYKVSDRGIAGSRFARAGMDFSWAAQQLIVASNSGVSIATVTTDTTIPASTIVPITVDVVCEFI